MHCSSSNAAYVPQSSRGTTSHAWAHVTDLFPSICGLAGCDSSSTATVLYPHTAVSSDFVEFETIKRELTETGFLALSCEQNAPAASVQRSNQNHRETWTDWTFGVCAEGLNVFTKNGCLYSQDRLRTIATGSLTSGPVLVMNA